MRSPAFEVLTIQGIQLILSLGQPSIYQYTLHNDNGNKKKNKKNKKTFNNKHTRSIKSLNDIGRVLTVTLNDLVQVVAR